VFSVRASCMAVMARASLPFASAKGRIVMNQKCAIAALITPSIFALSNHDKKFSISLWRRSGFGPTKWSVLGAESGAVASMVVCTSLGTSRNFKTLF